ncbi:GDSL esterase/lipase [Acorus calamus]|uniref:GDSL esterase/lipase n=1 Tax=Acorus calamus TaxID=4465 RepID=A0AAV9DUI2_ACOCL|nr:GDSL esterase/lipase [Acorus calamus]
MEGKGLHILLSSLSLVALLAIQSTDASVPAIYVFGDSTADVGNNNYLPMNAAKANFPFNGIDFPRGTPTGRFSNGYIGVDYMAKMYGFKRSPPPFLSLTAETIKGKIFSGVNFASGGSGILDTTGNEIPMTLQVQFFSTVVSNMTSHIGPASAHRLLSESLFLISIGANDLFADFAQFGPQNDTHKDEYVAILTSKYEDHLKKLYNLGARKIGIFGMGLLGCCPALRTKTPSGDCIEDLNLYARKFNRATKSMLHSLSSSLEGMKYTFGNSVKLWSNIFQHPSSYGLKELKSACCGGGRFNGETPCMPNATYCPNRQQYLFWDMFHPSQAAYKLTARAFYDVGSLRFVSPITFKQLAA